MPRRSAGLLHLPSTVAMSRPASTLRLPDGRWSTVLDCLCDHFAAISRQRWLSRFERGLVQDAAGNALRTTAAYRAGLEVRYFREVEAERPIPFVESIVHVDADLVVADKPHFLPVAPVGEWVEQTLLARLIRRLGNPALVPLHRIDRATAGLVLFSANPETRGRYQALFRERRITKVYEALASSLAGRSFPMRYRSRLVPDQPFFRMREEAGPPNSDTGIAVLGRDSPLWRYQLTPVTGRKHQLRVHMAALGAPIVNDPWYPALSPLADDDFRRPLALLARALEFIDPLSGALRGFSSARPLAAAHAEH